jgi:hypothetical protein
MSSTMGLEERAAPMHAQKGDPFCFVVSLACNHDIMHSDWDGYMRSWT